MPTENTVLKHVTPAGDSNTTDDMVILKSSTYQRFFLTVAGSLLALLVWITVAGTTSGQHLQSSAHEITESAMALADYQVDSANSAFTKDIFGLATSENEEGCDFAAGECPNIPGATCVTPNGQGVPCASEGNCNKICCGSNGFDDCCMCQEYCEQYAVCSDSDADQFHTSGCCCCNSIPGGKAGVTDCPRLYGGGYCVCGSPGCPTTYYSF